MLLLSQGILFSQDMPPDLAEHSSMSGCDMVGDNDAAGEVLTKGPRRRRRVGGDDAGGGGGSSFNSGFSL